VSIGNILNFGINRRSDFQESVGLFQMADKSNYAENNYKK